MKKFNDLALAPGLLRAAEELGFESPMPVQEIVIPLILEETCDIIALAQTGTGKTAAFGLPLIQAVDTTSNQIQALILCPTRELCMQITGDLKDYARYTGRFKIAAVYGGASIENQSALLRQGVQIVVATPGRLIDLIKRRTAKLASVSTVILDEADEMLNMGFLDSINEILEEVPETRRTLLFSATMSSEISTIARKYMKEPKEVTIGSRNASAANVTHGYYLVNPKDKYKALKRIADSEPDIYGIIFCRTRKETQEVASKLINDGYNADALHGDLSQAQRDTVMQKFRVRNLQLLVATDVAARGLDVDDLTHVINYSIPEDMEVYTHRSGRTGRAGKTGISISLLVPKEKGKLRSIEKLVKKQVNAIKVPTASEICGRQLFHWIKKLETVPTEHQEIEKYIPEVKRRLEDVNREELLRRVVSLQFGKFLEDYRSGEELEPVADNEMHYGDHERNKYGKHKTKYTRLFINLGKNDGFYPEQLIDLINKNTTGRKISLGKIELLKTFSFFEADSEYTEVIINALNNARFQERKVVVEVAQERGEVKDRDHKREKHKTKFHSEKRHKKDKKDKTKYFGRKDGRKK